MTSQWRRRNKTHSWYSELNSLQNVYFGFFIFGKLTEWRCFVTYLSNDPRIWNVSFCNSFPQDNKVPVSLHHNIHDWAETERHFRLHHLHSSSTWTDSCLPTADCVASPWQHRHRRPEQITIKQHSTHDFLLYVTTIFRRVDEHAFDNGPP